MSTNIVKQEGAVKMRNSKTSIVLSLVVALLLSFNFIHLSTEGSTDNVIDLDTGPFLWTHAGPMLIDSLEESFSNGRDHDTDFYIVQFRGPVGDPQIRMLESAGLRVLDYFPDYAYVINTENSYVNDIEDLPGVIGTSPFFSGIKVHPDFLKQFEDGKDPFADFNSITVETFTSESLENEFASIGLNFERAKDNRYVIHRPFPPLPLLMEMDGIKWIEPKPEMRLLNNVAAGIIDVDDVWDDLGLDGSGQIVGVSDTGIDTGVDNHAVYGDMHLDLDNRVTIFDWSGSGPDDDNGHGTHVAGSVAGSGARSNGNIRGMAYNSSLYFQALETDSGFLNTPSNLSQLFDQAYNNGARIHTNSWGSGVSTLWGAYTASSYDIDWSMFNTPDLLILYAAGNDGNDGNSDGKIDQNSISPPSTAKSSVTVGASENLRTTGGYQGSWGAGWPGEYPANPVASDRPSNNSRGLAAFSSRGPLDDGRLKPDVVAPGTNILSVRSSRGSSSGWGFYNSTYIYNGGTSMSTPITAGMAALVRQYYNQTMGIDAPSASLLKATIINGATDISPGQYGASNPTTKEIDRRPDVDQGWGRINLKDSLDPDGKSLSFMDNSSGISTGSNVTRMFRVLSSEDELRLTLAWSDYPGSLFAGKQLINDLDLVLYAPDGSIYNGNDFTAPFDDARDSINPVEGISIPNPVEGWWKVVVEGTNIPRGPQHFSLVSTGNITEMISNMLFLDRRFYSTDSDTVTISLSSRDHSGEGTLSIKISSDSDPAGKNITLTEEPTLGAFTGSFMTSNVSTSEPGILFVSNDDLISVEFESPYGFDYRANATAKKAKRVDLIPLDENRLTYSRYDNIRLRGVGDPGQEVEWTVKGSDLPWIGIFDDGIPSHGDETANDGIYNVVFYVSNEYDADGNITLRVKDPFLGYLEYPQFPIKIDPNRPGAPRDLEALSLPQGNSVRLKWNRSPTVGVLYYSVFINRTGTPPDFDISGWERYHNTTGPDNMTVATGLTDDTHYYFRVAAVGAGGNISSPSLWASAIPKDIVAPTIIFDDPPLIMTGIHTLDFDADDDLSNLELQYYEDENGDGMANDNGTFLPAVNSTGPEVVWDTRSSSGGPGDMDRIILRWRGSDEVPNISDWTYMGGFGIDNTGPPFLELSTYPPRITNDTFFDIIGDTEPLANVEAEFNGEPLGTFSAGMTGIFDLNLTLKEGRNYLNLTAYDLHGAGPTISNYIFTKDTRDPVASIIRTEKILEIRCNCTSFRSDSYDIGFDPDFRELANQTWTLVGPFGATSFHYGSSVNHTFDKTGIYTLSLRVEDQAGNWNRTSVSFEIVDTTPPVPVINGPDIGDEDTTLQYSISGSSDNDPGLIEEQRAQVLWVFEGPGEFFETSDRYEPFILFPEPGNYSVTLRMVDEGRNNATVSKTVSIRDITPPQISMIGERVFDPGEVAWFNLTVEDNAPEWLPGPEFLWQLLYLDGESSIPISTSEGDSFKVTLIDPGNYTLRITVTDSSGNSRNDSLQLLVRKPILIEEQDSDSSDSTPYTLIAIGTVVVGIILLIFFVLLIAGRRRYSRDVEMEWEDEDYDLDELDEVEDEEEAIDWEDEEDWESWE